jgi:hypothetical protein
MPISVSNMIVNIQNLFHNFNWGIFWTALGSVATSCACIIALWQTKHSNLKKIKLKYGTATAVDPLDQATTYFICQMFSFHVSIDIKILIFIK